MHPISTVPLCKILGQMGCLIMLFVAGAASGWWRCAVGGTPVTHNNNGASQPPVIPPGPLTGAADHIPADMSAVFDNVWMLLQWLPLDNEGEDEGIF